MKIWNKVQTLQELAKLSVKHMEKKENETMGREAQSLLHGLWARGGGHVLLRALAPDRAKIHCDLMATE